MSAKHFMGGAFAGAVVVGLPAAALLGAMFKSQELTIRIAALALGHRIPSFTEVEANDKGQGAA